MLSSDTIEFEGGVVVEAERRRNGENLPALGTRPGRGVRSRDAVVLDLRKSLLLHRLDLLPRQSRIYCVRRS